jgi:hypothetical protein
MRGSAVILLAAGILGCPGCFSVPAPKLKGLPLERELMSQWDCTSADPDQTDQAQLTVLRFDQHQYYAEWKEGEKVARYRAYPMRFKGVTAIIAIDLDSTKYWTPLRASVGRDKVLSLEVPSKRLLEMDDDKAAVAEFNAKADDPGSWQPFARCQPH